MACDGQENWKGILSQCYDTQIKNHCLSAPVIFFSGQARQYAFTSALSTVLDHRRALRLRGQMHSNSLLKCGR